MQCLSVQFKALLSIGDFNFMLENKFAQKIIFAGWIGIGMAISLFLFLLTPVSDVPSYVNLEIVPGSGFTEIAAILAEKGIIRSKTIFLIYGGMTGSAHLLKPGNYILNTGSSTPAVLGVIEKGPSIDVSVTIPEGATLKDIEVFLSRAGIAPIGSLNAISISEFANEYEFLMTQKSLEGFLFPDTYRFFRNSDTKTLVIKMLDNFNTKAWPLLRECKSKIEKCKEMDFLEVLTVASLLEKEVVSYSDRQLVAGILYKRLNVGVGLNVDATIAYAKCARAFVTCGDPKVYRRDLEFQSLYNTYLYKGLPPGPIGNPGLEAIKAALNPAQSDYFYYLSDPKTGKTIYSKTLDEHNDNRARYLGV